jgi:hypothetical protein
MAAPDGIVMRVHRVRGEVIVAACDAELIGRELPIGPGHATKVSPQFYGERRVSLEELLWALERATSANLLGPRVLRAAEAAGFVAAGGTGMLGGVPHAMIFSMNP